MRHFSIPRRDGLREEKASRIASLTGFGANTARTSASILWPLCSVRIMNGLTVMAGTVGHFSRSAVRCSSVARSCSSECLSSTGS